MGNNAVMIACREGMQSIVSYLVEQVKVDVNHYNIVSELSIQILLLY
jgi:hypothetical protein